MIPETELARLMELDGKRRDCHPFELVQGDAICRLKPHSCLNVNTVESWLVSQPGSGHKLRASAEFYGAAPDMMALLRWYDEKLRQAREALEHAAEASTNAAGIHYANVLAATDPTKPVPGAK